jgi:phosphinothricin acetyltransferase
MIDTVTMRKAERRDLSALVDIYNHYVVTTPITFDLEPYTVETRTPWFETFGDTGRYRLVVAEQDGRVVGYAGSMRYRPKAAYDTTVETTVYLRHDAVGNGLGGRLYDALFDMLHGEDIHMLYAGVTLPNDASVRMHTRCGFKPIATLPEVGRKFGKYWDVLWLAKVMDA